MIRRSAGALVALSLAAGSAAFAQPTDPRQTSCVLKLPGMEKIVPRTNLPFRTTAGRTLAFDLYMPPNPPSGGKAPVVVFVNGVGAPDSPLKEWGIYKDWARLTAVSGMAAVLHDSTPGTAAEDFAELISALRSRSAELKLDADNMAVWCSSANVRVGFPYAMDPAHTFLKALVVYYGVTDPALVRADLPVMLARAGIDMPYTNQSMAAWAAKALQLNAPVTMANLPNGRHGFDVTDDHEASRDVVRQTLAFLRANLSSDVQKGRAERDIPARAISLRGAGRHAEAEQAFRQWLTQEPGSGIAQQGLGDSLYQLKRYPEAARSYEKAGDAGVMPSVTWYNAACSYALSGDKEKALDLLAKAIGTGFIQDRESIRKDADLASMKDDPRFERILSGRNP